MIVIWKNTGHPDFVGKDIEFFKVSWSGIQWVRDPRGKWWGIEHPGKPPGRRNTRLMGHPTDYGSIVDPKESEMDTAVPAPKMGTPELDSFPTPPMDGLMEEFNIEEDDV